MLDSRLKIDDTEVPVTTQRHDFLFDAFEPGMNFEETHLKFSEDSRLTRLRLNKDLLEPIQEGVPSLFQNHGWYGFSNIYQEQTEVRSTAYGGLGLTYNPIFAHSVNPFKQVMGEGRSILPLDFFTSEKGKDFLYFLLDSKLDKFFFYRVLKNNFEFAQEWLADLPDSFDKEYVIEKLQRILLNPSSKRIKDTYADSYGFTSLTKAALWPPIYNFLSLFPMTLIRSRLVELRSHELDHHKEKFYWHRDNYPWIEYRVLICLTASHGGFGVELKDEGKFYLSPGDVFVFDTSKPHRAFSDSFEEGFRTCMVLGFSPWINFNSKSRVWEKNEFFGRKHPNYFLKDFIESKIFSIPLKEAS